MPRPHILGTAIKITAKLSNGPATAVTIKIEDNGRVAKVNGVDMTEVTTRVYTYIYQTNESTDTDGQYTVTISATVGGYTSKKQSKLEFIDPDLT